MSDKDFLVDLVAEYYCADLSPLFASSKTVLCPSNDSLSRVIAMRKNVIGGRARAINYIGRLKRGKFDPEWSLLLEGEVIRACDHVVREYHLTGVLEDEYSLLCHSLRHDATNRRFIQFKRNQAIDSCSFESKVLCALWRVFRFITDELEKPGMAGEFRRRCVGKCLDVLCKKS